MTIAPSPLQPIVRKLRRDSTETERKVWYALRAKRLDGFHIRRQHETEGYIVDFACVASRLVIELDGGQHCDNADDKIRDARLQKAGWKVLRFWNNEVNENLEGVLTVIREALYERAK